MINYKRTERAQAIVIVVFAIIGLIAMTALAIDAGYSFSDRRHAQTAADNAALGGALAKANPPQDVATQVFLYTSKNGYVDDPISGSPRVTLIEGGPFTDCSGNTIDPVNHADFTDDISQYLQVTIRSSVDTFFGQIVGIPQLNNCVYAIARAKLGVPTSLFWGNAVAAAGCTGDRSVIVSGSSTVRLIDGGIFSNSNGNPAVYIHDPTNLVTPGIGSVGPIYAPGWDSSTSPTTPGMEQWPCPLPDEMIPDYTCDFTYDDFPPSSSDAHVTVLGSITTIDPGTYCITGTFSNPPLEGHNVTFILLNEGISWSGNNEVTLTAPTDTSSPTVNLLIFVPYSNSNELRFNGTSGLHIEGSIFAPNSDIVLLGDFGGNAIRSQWVGRTVDMSGSVNATFQYDDARVYKYPNPPQVELNK